MLGGHHTGNWDGDFTAKPPKFFGSGSVSKVAMAQVATLMHDAWATGTLDGQYTLGDAGLDAAALRDSATGTANFKWTGGSLRHIVLEGKAAPLSFSSLDRPGRRPKRNPQLRRLQAAIGQRCLIRSRATRVSPAISISS